MPLDFTQLSVMVVDANFHMRTLLESILKSFGVRQIIGAGDGSEALKEMKTRYVDIVMTDWYMDPLDGLDFTRLLRTSEDSPNRYIPIIMVTGHTEAHRVAEARDSGVTEFLAKPVSPRGLYVRLETVVLKPRSFITTPIFTGPCRRRRELPRIGKPERRADAHDAPIPEPAVCDQVHAAAV